MNVYKSMYLLLFNGVTDALRLMSKDPGAGGACAESGAAKM